MPEGVPFNLTDYLELVDWSGRIIREDRKGAIPATLPAILQRLDMDARHSVYLTKNFEQPFEGLVGARTMCVKRMKIWVSAGSMAWSNVKSIFK